MIFEFRPLASAWLLTICIITGPLVCRSREANAESIAEGPNVVLILSDDHRYDFMTFHPDAPAFLETPHLDRLASQGVHLANAFVSTSLCSPSRASILSGQYMHRHNVVDNQRPVPEGTQFFPSLLQSHGYQTAFVGKWHMGHEDDSPRPGFDHWVSFKGQGTYHDPQLNVNGERLDYKGYTTDVLADRALEWLATKRNDAAPFFLMLSFKAVHYPFLPAERHRGRYAEAEIDYPETMANTQRNYQTQPRWVRERRYSIHGIDHMETGAFDKDPVPDFDALYRRYCETVHGLDENVGRVLNALDEHELADDTVVIYLGDNGFALGEHGFYDKRDAFEESIRIPLLVRAPGNERPGRSISAMVQNIDIAPTILEACGVQAPKSWTMDGRSFWPLITGATVDWRKHILYEYHWEWNFPATPTTLAIRTERYKYIFYHGTWDANGLYDLKTDPHERHNLVAIPAYAELRDRLQSQLFAELEASGGLHLPIRAPAGERLDQRKLRR
jgi:N-acetylglucosamine-6-sulfatase